MNRLTIGGGLYSPLEVEIDGQVFKVRKIGRAISAEFDRLRADYEAKAQDLTADRKGYALLELLYAQLVLALEDAAKEAIEGLDFHEAAELIKFITTQEKDGGKGDAEKNALKPGGEPAP